MLKRLAVLRPDRALGAQSSTLPPAVRRPCTHGDIGRVLHQHTALSPTVDDATSSGYAERAERALERPL